MEGHDSQPSIHFRITWGASKHTNTWPGVSGVDTLKQNLWDLELGMGLFTNYPDHSNMHPDMRTTDLCVVLLLTVIGTSPHVGDTRPPPFPKPQASSLQPAFPLQG